MDQPCFRSVSANFTYDEANPSRRQKLVAPSPVENSRSFLRRPGAWAMAAKARRRHFLYYRAAAGENPNRERFVAPVRTALVRGGGTRSAPLADVSFRGLEFADTGWSEPSSGRGFVGMFGDYYYAGGSPSGSLTEATTRARFVPAALGFHDTYGLLFEGDRFQRLGAGAVAITGTRDNVFRGNVFGDIAGGALKLNGLDDGSDTGNLVEDNWVHRIGADYQQSIGIYLEDIVDSTISHNQLDHLPFSGISQTISEAHGHGVQILGNRIFDVVRVMMDGGGIYTSGAQGTSWGTGTTIEGNDVHGALNPRIERNDPQHRIGAPNGIYTDVGGDFITLRRNVVYDSHQSWGGVEPKRMRFEGNFWDDDQLVFYGSRKHLRIAGNTLLGRRDPRARCAALAGCRAILDSAGLEPQWRRLNGPADRAIP